MLCATSGFGNIEAVYTWNRAVPCLARAERSAARLDCFAVYTTNQPLPCSTYEMHHGSLQTTRGFSIYVYLVETKTPS